mgnify:CR=1 FL=1
MIEKLSEEHLQHILKLHLHPTKGTDYWIEEYGEEGYKKIVDVVDFESFKRFFSLDIEAQKSFLQYKHSAI